MTDMQALKAHVKSGRLLLDEPTELPEGEVVYLVSLNDPEEMDDEEKARLDAALELSMEQARAGQLLDGADVIGRLLARG